MDKKLKHVINQGLAAAKLCMKWRHAHSAYRYSVMACCVKITFYDASEVTRYGDIWLVTYPGQEAVEFIRAINEELQKLKRYQGADFT